MKFSLDYFCCLISLLTLNSDLLFKKTSIISLIQAMMNKIYYPYVLLESAKRRIVKQLL
ncbi:hypothetical protein DSECCO2_94260 [anaerobic digester metagenome]